MAGADSKVVLELLLEDKKFLANVKSAVKRLNDVGTAGKGVGGIFKKLPDGIEQLGSSLKKTMGILGGLAAVAGGVLAALGFKGAIDAAREQERAIKGVAIALKNTGDASKASLGDMVAFSETMQDQTGIADDQILKLSSLALSMGATKDQAKDLTRAAVEMSAATGKDLETSLKLLTQSLNGNVGALKKVNPEFAKLSEMALKAGGAAQVAMKLFGGTAAGQLQTFDGALLRTQNNLGDMLEEVGNLVIKSPAVIGVIGAFGDAFKILGSTIKANDKDLRKFIQTSIVGILKAVKATLKPMQILIASLGLLATATPMAAVVKAFERLNITVEKGGNFAASAASKFLLMHAAILEFYKIATLVPGTIQKVLGFEPIGDSLGLHEASKTVALLRADLDKIAAGGAVTELAGGAVTGASGFDKLSESIGKLIDQLELMPDTIDVPELAAGDGGGGGKGGKGGSASTVGLFDWGPLMNGLAKFRDGAVKAFDDITMSFVSNLGGGEEGAKRFVAEAGGSVAEMIGTALGGQGNWWGQLVSAIINVFSDERTFKSLIDGFMKAVPQIINTVVDNLPYFFVALAENSGEIITALINAIPRFITAFVRAIPDIAKALINEIIGGITYQLGKLNSFFDNFGSAVEKAGAFVSDTWKKIDWKKMASDAWNGIKDAIMTFFSSLGSQLSSAIGNAGTEFLNRIIQAAKDFADKIKPGGKSGGYLGQVGGKLKATYDNIVGGATGGLVAGGSGVRDDQLMALKKGELIIDPPTTRKLDAALSNGKFAGSGGDVEMKLLLAQILAELQKPMAVEAEMKNLDKRFIGDVVLQLTRTNARTA